MWTLFKDNSSSFTNKHPPVKNQHVRKSHQRLVPQRSSFSITNETILVPVTEYKHFYSQFIVLHHINMLQTKVKAKLGFLYRNHSSFTFSANRAIIEMCTLWLFDYADRTYAKEVFQKLDTIYYFPIRFIINDPYKTHHSLLYSQVNWHSLLSRWNIHCLLFIYKTLLGLSPPSLNQLLQKIPTQDTMLIHSNLLNWKSLNGFFWPFVFLFCDCNDSNFYQNTLHLDTLI